MENKYLKVHKGRMLIFGLPTLFFFVLGWVVFHIGSVFRWSGAEIGKVSAWFFGQMAMFVSKEEFNHAMEEKEESEERG